MVTLKIITSESPDMINQAIYVKWQGNTTSSLPLRHTTIMVALLSSKVIIYKLSKIICIDNIYTTNNLRYAILVTYMIKMDRLPSDILETCNGLCKLFTHLCIVLS